MKPVDKNHSCPPKLRPQAAAGDKADKATPATDRLACHCYESFPDAEAALLCCFDTWLRAEQSKKQLRRALIAAGFAPGAVNYLIRNSRLLDRVSRRRYRVRPFAAGSARA